MTTRRLSRSLAMFAAGAALLVAAGLAHSATEARKGGTFRLSMPADVDFVDPGLAYFARSWPIGYATCAKLFNYPDAGGAAGTRLGPEVVRSYRISGDGRTYTFELKRTFRFHTGARVTAQSYADALNRVAHPKLESPAITYMGEIAGAAAVIAGRANAISGVRVLGPYRLQIQLTKPVADFTARLTLPFFCPILPDTPIEPGGIDNPAGSGPYYIAERTVNQRIVLRRNPYYRGNRPANVDEVIWTITTQEECVLAIERSSIDYCFFGGLAGGALFRELAERYGINRAGGQFFVSPLTRHLVLRVQPRPARVRRPRPDPAQEGDQLRDGQTRARAHARLPRREAHGPDAAGGPRALGEDLSARGRRPPRRRGSCSRARSSGRES